MKKTTLKKPFNLRQAINAEQREMNKLSKDKSVPPREKAGAAILALTKILRIIRSSKQRNARRK